MICACNWDLQIDVRKQDGGLSMSSVRLVSDSERELLPAVSASEVFSWTICSYIAIGAMCLVMIGTWLVWFSTSLQHSFQEEQIRTSCQRVMPDTADRCFDTVVIQRGGVRR